MVVKLHKFLYLFLATLTILTFTTLHVSANSRLDFKYEYKSNSPDYNAVERALGRAKIKEIYGGAIEDGEDPLIAIARHDLNKDGKNEIIAVFNDDIMACRHVEEKGHSTAHHSATQCPYFVFTYTRRGMILIGEFMAGGLMVSDKSTSGIADLVVFPDANKNIATITYKWAGRSYQPVTK